MMSPTTSVSTDATPAGISYGTSDRYASDQGVAYFAYQNRCAALGAELNARKFSRHIQSSDRVMDFGCGGGWLLTKLPGREKVGVELSDAAREVCRANNITAYKSVADLGDRRFDVIVTHHCLEHVPYPIAALRELREHLASGGRLLVVVPLDDWRRQRDHAGTDIDHHLHTWTPRLFANTLVEAGFAIDTMSVLTHAWFPYWDRLYRRIPQFAFDFGCGLWSVLQHKRQLFALARNLA